MSSQPAGRAPSITLCGGTRLSRDLQPGVPLTIGHAKSAGLRIPHPALSPIHCTLIWADSQISLRDEGSQSGTMVNGQPITGQVLVHPGDIIGVGLFQLQLTWETGIVPDAPLSESPAAGGTANPSDRPGRPAAPPAIDFPPGQAVSFRGHPVTEVPVFANLTLGNGDQVDLFLPDHELSPIHAVIESEPGGFVVVDRGRTGSLANGKYFDRHSLVIGDLLQFGSRHFFVFDGFALRPVRDGLGCGLQAFGLEVTVGRRRRQILQSVTFDARPGQFVGILGPSGSGKTTLLRALLGLRPISGGTILLDGQNLDQLPDPSRFFGYVPQQEIVHLELTAREALEFSALLRLPLRTPRHEIDKLIGSLTARLGLEQHLDTRAARLSGGQLKRLSVCVELLSRPPLLCLDEPTSGLDPESETELMQQLQELSYTGCTVVCTTHLMENIHLMSSIEVVMAGRDSQGRPTPGRTVFRGKPRVAREVFDVRSLSKLYHRLKDQSPEEWQRHYETKTGESLTAPPPPPPGLRRAAQLPPRPRRRLAVPILLRRQWRILRSDWKNLVLLAGQPLLIGALIAVVATGEDPSDKKLFLAAIATLWLGCGNAAPEIVRERSVFRREQFVGLRASSYLLSKFLGLGLLTGLQAIFLFALLSLLGSGLDGSAAWQVTGLLASAAAATGLGLAISAWARTTLQAVLLVPLVIIPQILFAGFVFPVRDWDAHAMPRLSSRLFPSFAAQRIMDVSLLWNRPVEQATAYSTALDNLTTSLRPVRILLHPNQATTVTLDESRLYAPPPPGVEPFGPREFHWDPSKPNILTPRYVVPTLRDDRPRLWRHPTPALAGLSSLALWTLVSSAAAWLALRWRDQE
ncbi:MAG: ATP-binding cassette domain-containing protein [Verrucomicrobiales bacterium]